MVMDNKYTMSEFFQALLDAPKENVFAQNILDSINKASIAAMDKLNASKDNNFVYGCLALPENKPSHSDNLILKLQGNKHENNS